MANGAGKCKSVTLQIIVKIFDKFQCCMQGFFLNIKAK